MDGMGEVETDSFAHLVVVPEARMSQDVQEIYFRGTKGFCNSCMHIPVCPDFILIFALGGHFFLSLIHSFIHFNTGHLAARYYFVQITIHKNALP